MIFRPKERMITELLGDPLVQMMMHADRVDPQDLARELHKLANALKPKSLPIACRVCPA
ncbi:hypothetical protein [Methylovirgula sp. HY1]|uniref:hypothetical protein n=1 Tax=Methylovirgula sp. HY1 TaxID=2822761 RepID=UPI001C5BFA73|nr:hypothetical protein [Methylovirgula sp. HY1]QXX74581.1 hypothetical protein MHY1_01396 [Methylovirgula sp. HY1]